MKIAVMGAGGVGGYYGGLLAQHGEEVWLIARGDHRLTKSFSTSWSGLRTSLASNSCAITRSPIGKDSPASRVTFRHRLAVYAW